VTDDVVSAVEGVTRTWKLEAEKRRHISKADPVADTLEYCAGEIASRVKAVQFSDRGLTVEQYAKLPHVGVTAQTVRHWIRTRQLLAIETPKGYRIAADAKRMRRSA
jgi:hypothetical protein